MTALTSILRDATTAPHVFGALDGDPVAATALEFIPLPNLPVCAPPSGDGAAAEPPTPPDPAVSFEEGRQAGRAERDGEVEALQTEVTRLRTAAEQAGAHDARVAEAASQLAVLWAEAARGMEPALAALAIETAEAVLAAPLSADQRAAADRAIAEAVDSLVADGPLVIALHPVDLLHLQEGGLADALSRSHPGLRWEPDASFAEGDWTASTSQASIRRVRTDMVAGLRDRLGLTA